jgi:hypothetical protein
MLVFTSLLFKMPFEGWNIAKPFLKIKGPSYHLISPNSTGKTRIKTGERTEGVVQLVKVEVVQAAAPVAARNAEKEMVMMVIHGVGEKAKGGEMDNEAEGPEPT